MELGYLKITGNQVFIAKKFLTQNFIPPSEIESILRDSPQNGNSKYINYFDSETRNTWINYSTIPKKHLKKYGLPRSRDRIIRILHDAVSQDKGESNLSLLFLFNIVWNDEKHWIRFLPHYNCFDLEAFRIEKLAKTHALIELIITYKRDKTFDIREIYFTYMRMPHVYFKAGSLAYFYRKMKKFEREGIPETLVHNFTRYGRTPYKLDSGVVALVQRHRISKKPYKICLIHRMVNLELISRGKRPISRSAVSRIVNEPEFANKSDFLRLGKAHTEQKILPFLRRSKIEKVGRLYEIDGKDLHIRVDTNGQVMKLWMFIVYDCASRKVVGYDFGTTENLRLVLNTIRNAFQRGKVIPEYMVYDRHGLTRDAQYKLFKSKIRDYGISLRQTRAKNPGDKGHIESWFGHFANYHLCKIKGYLGCGLKSLTTGGRIEEELERLYFKKEMETFNDVVPKIKKEIRRYNSTIRKNERASPKLTFSYQRSKLENHFKPHDIAYLFGVQKNLTILRGMAFVRFKNGEASLSYTIKDRRFANSVNRTKVKLFYHPENPSYSYLYGIGNKFLGKLALDKLLSPIASSKGEMKQMQDFHLANIRTVVENTNEVFEEIQQGETELEISTVKVLDYDTLNELDELKNEDLELIKKTVLISRPYHQINMNNLHNESFNIYRPRKSKKRRSKKS